jgi:sigma-B regulation protein RsbU (phosphoserine phosphatase)
MAGKAESTMSGKRAGKSALRVGGVEITKIEIALVASVLLYGLVTWTQASLVLELTLLITSIGLLIVAGARRIRTLMWRLRNRLIVAYFVIGVVPVVSILLLAGFTARHAGGQVGVYLVHAELERRLGVLNGAARMVARASNERRQAALDRIEAFYSERFPGLRVIIADAATPAPDAPPRAWGEIEGIVVKDGLLFAWARAIQGDRQVTMLVPLTRRWLSELTPSLGEVSIVHFPDPVSAGAVRRIAMRPHPAPGGEEEELPVIPPPVNRFDIELLWASEIPVAIWDSPQVLERSLLAVHSRLSAVLGILFAHKTPMPYLLYIVAIAFLVAELIAIQIGVSITRTITGAVHDLYEGTERVMRGDFSHRIRVKGNEQIAELSRSFNRMTENLEHLLAVAKEKERMQAELEIAREVQNQLFPRAAPELKRLQLRAMCNPARMVSGDYYDYPPLGDGKIALAIGDVAGKGISAALLMATLQSALRSEVRHLRGVNGSPAAVSTSSIVSRLNLQLYADTAPEKYATFCFAVYDDASGRLTYTNAGHLPPLLVRRGKVTALDVNGMVVGAFPFAKYDESSLVLESGDLLVFYTDGIVEPENEFGEMFGEQQLKELLLRSAQLETEQILNVVIDAVQRHTGSPELQDDMTILVARRS